MAKKAKTEKATEKPVESLEKDLGRVPPGVSTEDTQRTPMALSEASQVEDRLKNDFRLFLFVIWQHIGLPDPTPLQYDLAHFMAHGPNKKCIEAFRGVGKSFIAAAYVLWRLWKDPQLKILVVSASKNRADNFTTFAMRLVNEVPILQHLKPRPEQRQSKIEFDVAPAIADQSPSVKSVGITGQLTGTRADIIISDDVEVLNNSATSDMREKLLERTREYSAILKPLPDAQIIYLGTPQTEDSIYAKIPETFTTRIWPARVPNSKQADTYGQHLAPYVSKMLGNKEAGVPTDPLRFDENDLIAREAEYGKAGFALQFMLNTQLSDLERFPLKVKDLIIMDTQVERAPMKVEWLPDPDRECRDLHNVGMAGDRMFYAAGYSSEWGDYTGSVLAIDPAGRGKDETGYAVVKMLNGQLFVRQCGGLQGGYDDQTLQRLALIAKEENVNKVVIEANFGDGMFTRLFTPVISKVHKVSIEEVKHSTQKERRIIDTLEPVMARHKLIIDKKVISDDWHSVQPYDSSTRISKMLVYQLTRITYDRGSLKHDDRLDALAMGVNYWTEQMSRDADRGIRESNQKALDAELKSFINSALGRKNYGPQHRTWMKR
ncbi:phage terminase large subunit [Limnobacter sp.]|uniref:phage terminase large subunit n=1 Tax=Limnobacter sp. TaxID=2003368 RepID=UPI0025C5B0B3|nr:phage terminase large subunit [Limnobacter sp.]